MDKALNYLGLARKASLVELGEEPVTNAARSHLARLVVVASDAGDHTWRKATGLVSGTEQQCIKVPFTKDQLGQAVGRTSLALAAFTDPALALAFLKALDAPNPQVIEKLEACAQRLRQRQKKKPKPGKRK